MLLQTHGCLPAQMGHPLPRAVLSLTAASQAWACPHSPRVQSHHTWRPDPHVTSTGVRDPLRVGCHWLAMSGRPTVRAGWPAAAVWFHVLVEAQLVCSMFS